ncbi:MULTISPECIES: hypothetical protein [Mycolicibacterium]|uniref:hypothetical protein n=1 Tax=Mycolicibacterium TaxID=1866885 RepID=UPI00262A94F9|nr:hypothetical protein [Mycolicibacterium fortuitum]
MTATPSPHGTWVLARGPVFDQPGLAKRVLEAVFSDLIDVDDIGRSALDELATCQRPPSVGSVSNRLRRQD